MKNRLYSLLEVKEVDAEKRLLTGIASTPTPDRMNDVVELDGMEFKTPMPFLYQHNSRQPIGQVIAAKKTKAGLEIKAQLAGDIGVPFITEAWALIKAGLVRGLSIGFRSIEEAYNKETGGYRFIKTELFEISAVTIPANAEASILSVKSADSQALAALGRERRVLRLDKNLPGDSGPTVSKGKTMAKTIQQQIDDWQQKKAAAQTRMDAIMEKSGEESRELDPAEDEEYGNLSTDIKSIDKHLARLKEHEQSLVARATKVTPENTIGAEEASNRRGGILTVRSNVPKGTAFTRMVMALAATARTRQNPADYAKRWKDSTPEVEMILRANSDIGTTTDADWAAPLLQNAQNVTGEFIELLRPATIIGRLTMLRRVPFRVRVPAQTGAGTYGWVGQGAAKPVGQLAFDDVSLDFAKIAGILVISEELARFSSPSAEDLIRNDMVLGTARFSDSQFVDPAVAEVANVSPASITNGVAPTAASGTTAAAFRTDMKAAMGSFITANDDLTSVVILMSPTVALNLSLLQNALGQPEFPGIGINGGSILGIPVLTSSNVGARIILVKQSDILIADDGGVTIDVSREASVEMSTSPSNSPQATEMVSLWQRNLVGLRVDRFQTWKKARATSVAYISNASYSG